MPDKGASICLVVRCVTMWMGITRHNLVKTTEKMVGADSGQIKLDVVLFLNLTKGNTSRSQLVYVTPEVTWLFLSQKARK